MNIIFFGNTKYSLIVAKKIHHFFPLSSIVTLPPRLLGRKKVKTPNPVHNFATEHNIPVILIEKFNNLTIQQFNTLITDFFVVADYGLILPKEVLSIPKIAPLNIHHSLLPKYRGPSPAPFSILNGDTVTGVTVIKMNEKMDAGPILVQEEYKMKPDETTDSLLIALNTLGAEILIPLIKNYDSVESKPQDEAKASYSKLFTKNDGHIDIENPPPAQQLDRMIRAYYPWPSVWTKVVSRSDLDKGPTFQKERIIKFLPNQKIQVEGKKPMGYKDFVNGYPEGKGLLDKIFRKV